MIELQLKNYRASPAPARGRECECPDGPDDRPGERADDRPGDNVDERAGDSLVERASARRKVALTIGLESRFIS